MMLSFCDAVIGSRRSIPTGVQAQENAERRLICAPRLLSNAEAKPFPIIDIRRERRSRTKMPRKLTIGLCMGLMLAVAAPVASAQNAPPPAASAEHSEIEAKAVNLLKAASAALAGAQTLSFTSTATYERAARNGQPLFYSTVSKVTMQRPDKLRVITIGDRTPDEFYYDGKTMMAYVPSADLVAIADAPPTIDKLLDVVWEKAAIYFPFSDVLASDPYAELSKKLHSAFYVGRSIAVGGVKTDMVAIAGDDAAAEIWIGADDHLPRMIRVVYANEPAHALYQTEFSDWRLGDKIDESAFTSAKAAKAKRIDFAPPGGPKPPEAPAPVPTEKK
jgi:hypothetical protein